MNKIEIDTNVDPRLLPLIKTWAWMMSYENSFEVQTKGEENLIQTFGSLSKAEEYLSITGRLV